MMVDEYTTPALSFGQVDSGHTDDGLYCSACCRRRRTHDSAGCLEPRLRGRSSYWPRSTKNEPLRAKLRQCGTRRKWRMGTTWESTHESVGIYSVTTSSYAECGRTTCKSLYRRRWSGGSCRGSTVRESSVIGESAEPRWQLRDGIDGLSGWLM
jgi:hypothetical protein